MQREKLFNCINKTFSAFKGKVIYKSFEYILKIDSPKNLSPNVIVNIMRTQKYHCSFCGITMWSGGRANGPARSPRARAGPGPQI